MKNTFQSFKKIILVDERIEISVNLIHFSRCCGHCEGHNMKNIHATRLNGAILREKFI